jgi:hypothetical protein
VNWQRLEQHAVHNAKQRGAHSNSKGKNQDGYEKKSWLSNHQPGGLRKCPHSIGDGVPHSFLSFSRPYRRAEPTRAKHRIAVFGEGEHIASTVRAFLINVWVEPRGQERVKKLNIEFSQAAKMSRSTEKIAPNASNCDFLSDGHEGFSQSAFFTRSRWDVSRLFDF